MSAFASRVAGERSFLAVPLRADDKPAPPPVNVSATPYAWRDPSTHGPASRSMVAQSSAGTFGPSWPLAPPVRRS